MIKEDFRQMQATNEQNQSKSPRAPEVLIVGAGPSGLMMAIQLLRHGVHPILIDHNLGPIRQAGVSFLQARSLEMLDQLNLADRVIEKGEKLSKLAFLDHESPLDLEELPDPLTRFPFVLAIPAAQLIRVLMDDLTTKAFKIQWNTHLERLQEKDDQVIVEVRKNYHTEKSIESVASTAPEALQTWRMDWVIGADGPHSTVRHDLGVSVEKKHFSQQYFQVEMVPDSMPEHLPEEPLPTGEGRVWVHHGQLFSAFPLRGGHRFLLSGSRHSGEHSPGSLLTYLERTFARYTSGLRLRPAPDTLITQAMTRSIASLFAGRRAFLVGDAAHFHLPLTQQGLDAGFLDAWNLGWKLAGVVQGRVDRKILQTYHTERHIQARRQAGLQDRMKNIAWPETILRIQKSAPFLLQRVLPALFSYIQKKPLRLAQFYSHFAGLEENHRHSALSAHYSRSETIRSGDRFPWLPIYDEKKKEWTDSHSALKKAGFTLMVMGPVSHHTLHVLGQWIKQKYPQGMNLFYIPYSQTNHRLFELFGMDAHSVQLCLVRPDTHITFLTNSLHTPLIDDYLAENLGWKLYRQFE